MRVFKNGVEQTLTWDNDQLLGISLGMAFLDGEIGTGQISVAGNQGWVAGDRISVYEANTLIYTGYVMDQAGGRAITPLDLQVEYQLMDQNRQLIGRKVVDQEFPLEYSLDGLVGGFQPLIEGAGSPRPSVDDTTWVDTSATEIFPPKTYRSDGATDWIADIIRFTAKTVYLGLTSTENRFALHVHSLAGGPGSALSISDVSGAHNGTTVFAPSGPGWALSAGDLKNNIVASNGVTTVSNTNAGSVTTHGAGGLGFEAVLDFGGLNEDSLILAVASIIATAGDEKGSYSCTLLNLLPEQLVELRNGALIAVTSTAMRLATVTKRISHVTLTITRDVEGRPVTGRWDATLQLDWPYRTNTAVHGTGTTGGDSGRLGTLITWNDTKVIEDDPAIPVGSTETVTAQLIDTNTGAYIAVPDVSMTWSVVQPDKTTTHPDYSTLNDLDVAATTSLTDISGQAHIRVKRDADTIGPDHAVKADPT